MVTVNFGSLKPWGVEEVKGVRVDLCTWDTKEGPEAKVAMAQIAPAPKAAQEMADRVDRADVAAMRVVVVLEDQAALGVMVRP
jgi:hypothetical protein